jgi:hypothetical protein
MKKHKNKPCPAHPLKAEQQRLEKKLMKIEKESKRLKLSYIKLAKKIIKE